MKKTVSTLSAIALVLAFGYAGDKMSEARADAKASSSIVSYADLVIVKADEAQYSEYNDSTSVLVQLPGKLASAAILKRAAEAEYTEYNDSTTVLVQL